MKKIYYLFICCLLMTILFSCEKSETLKPTNINEDYFTVPADATDPVSVLRRKFYERTGVHLLFNDTLRHEQCGTNPDGSPYWFTEVIDPAFGLTTSNARNYQYDYLVDEQTMLEGIDYAENYLLSRLGKKLRPYSILIVGKMYYEDDAYNDVWSSTPKIKEVNYYNGLRCFVINMNKIQTEATKKSISQSVFKDIINTNITLLDASVMEKYYAYCSTYYSKRLADFGLPNMPTIEATYPFGFIQPRDGYMYSSFLSKTSELPTFLTAFFANTEEEFITKYGTFPILMGKYETMKKIAIDMGFIF